MNIWFKRYGCFKLAKAEDMDVLKYIVMDVLHVRCVYITICKEDGLV